MENDETLIMGRRSSCTHTKVPHKKSVSPKQSEGQMSGCNDNTTKRLHSAVHQEELLYEPRVVIERCDQIDHLRAMHYGHGLKKQQQIMVKGYARQDSLQNAVAERQRNVMSLERSKSNSQCSKKRKNTLDGDVSKKRSKSIRNLYVPQETSRMLNQKGSDSHMSLDNFSLKSLTHGNEVYNCPDESMFQVAGRNEITAAVEQVHTHDIELNSIRNVVITDCLNNDYGVQRSSLQKHNVSQLKLHGQNFKESNLNNIVGSSLRVDCDCHVHNTQHSLDGQCSHMFVTAGEVKDLKFNPECLKKSQSKPSSHKKRTSSLIDSGEGNKYLPHGVVVSVECAVDCDEKITVSNKNRRKRENCENGNEKRLCRIGKDISISPATSKHYQDSEESISSVRTKSNNISYSSLEQLLLKAKDDLASNPQVIAYINSVSSTVGVTGIECVPRGVSFCGRDLYGVSGKVSPVVNLETDPAVESNPDQVMSNSTSAVSLSSMSCSSFANFDENYVLDTLSPKSAADDDFESSHTNSMSYSNSSDGVDSNDMNENECKNSVMGTVNVEYSLQNLSNISANIHSPNTPEAHNFLENISSLASGPSEESRIRLLHPSAEGLEYKSTNMKCRSQNARTSSVEMHSVQSVVSCRDIVPVGEISTTNSNYLQCRKNRSIVKNQQTMSGMSPSSDMSQSTRTSCDINFSSQNKGQQTDRDTFLSSHKLTRNNFCDSLENVTNVHDKQINNGISENVEFSGAGKRNVSYKIPHAAMKGVNNNMVTLKDTLSETTNISKTAQFGVLKKTSSNTVNLSQEISTGISDYLALLERGSDKEASVETPRHTSSEDFRQSGESERDVWQSDTSVICTKNVFVEDSTKVDCNKSAKNSECDNIIHISSGVVQTDKLNNASKLTLVCKSENSSRNIFKESESMRPPSHRKTGERSVNLDRTPHPTTAPPSILTCKCDKNCHKEKSLGIDLCLGKKHQTERMQDSGKSPFRKLSKSLQPLSSKVLEKTECSEPLNKSTLVSCTQKTCNVSQNKKGTRCSPVIYTHHSGHPACHSDIFSPKLIPKVSENFTNNKNQNTSQESGKSPIPLKPSLKPNLLPPPSLPPPRANLRNAVSICKELPSVITKRISPVSERISAIVTDSCVVPISRISREGNAFSLQNDTRSPVKFPSVTIAESSLSPVTPSPSSTEKNRTSQKSDSFAEELDYEPDDDCISLCAESCIDDLLEREELSKRVALTRSATSSSVVQSDENTNEEGKDCRSVCIKTPCNTDEDVRDKSNEKAESEYKDIQDYIVDDMDEKAELEYKDIQDYIVDNMDDISMIQCLENIPKVVKEGFVIDSDSNTVIDQDIYSVAWNDCFENSYIEMNNEENPHISQFFRPYCSQFLQEKLCSNVNCIFLHEVPDVQKMDGQIKETMLFSKQCNFTHFIDSAFDVLINMVCKQSSHGEWENLFHLADICGIFEAEAVKRILMHVASSTYVCSASISELLMLLLERNHLSVCLDGFKMFSKVGCDSFPSELLKRLINEVSYKTYSAAFCRELYDDVIFHISPSNFKDIEPVLQDTFSMKLVDYGLKKQAESFRSKFSFPTVSDKLVSSVKSEDCSSDTKKNMSEVIDTGQYVNMSQTDDKSICQNASEQKEKSLPVHRNHRNIMPKCKMSQKPYSYKFRHLKNDNQVSATAQHGNVSKLSDVTDLRQRLNEKRKRLFRGSMSYTGKTSDYLDISNSSGKSSEQTRMTVTKESGCERKVVRHLQCSTSMLDDGLYQNSRMALHTNSVDHFQELDTPSSCYYEQKNLNTKVTQWGVNVYKQKDINTRGTPGVNAYKKKNVNTRGTPGVEAYKKKNVNTRGEWNDFNTRCMPGFNVYKQKDFNTLNDHPHGLFQSQGPSLLSQPVYSTPSQRQHKPCDMSHEQNTEWNAESDRILLCTALRNNDWNSLVCVLEKWRGRIKMSDIAYEMYEVLKQDVQGSNVTFAQLVRKAVKGNFRCFPFLKDVLSTIGMNLMLDLIIQYNWQGAYDIYSTVRENDINIQHSEIFKEEEFSPCRKVLSCAEVCFQIGSMNEAVLILKSNNLLSPDMNQWRVKHAEGDFEMWLQICVTLLYQMTVDGPLLLAYDFFLALWKAQGNLSEGVELQKYSNTLVVRLLDENYRHEALELYSHIKTHFHALESHTYRALLVTFVSENDTYMANTVYQAARHMRIYSCPRVKEYPFHVKIYSYFLAEEIYTVLNDFLVQLANESRRDLYDNPDPINYKASIWIQVPEYPAQNSVELIPKLLKTVDRSMNGIQRRVYTVLRQFFPELAICEEVSHSNSIGLEPQSVIKYLQFILYRLPSPTNQFH